MHVRGLETLNKSVFFRAYSIPKLVYTMPASSCDFQTRGTSLIPELGEMTLPNHCVHMHFVLEFLCSFKYFMYFSNLFCGLFRGYGGLALLCLEGMEVGIWVW